MFKNVLACLTVLLTLMLMASMIVSSSVWTTGASDYWGGRQWEWMVVRLVESTRRKVNGWKVDWKLSGD